jgi:hypothetical protein
VLSGWALLPIALAVTLLWWPMRRWARAPRWIGTLALSAALASLPWLADRAHFVAFSIFALFAAAWLPAKVADSAMVPAIWIDRPFRQWLHFLVLPIVVCFRGHLRDPHRPLSESAWLALRGLLEMIAGAALFWWAFQHDWSAAPRLVEHAVKIVALYLLVLDGFFALTTGLLRLSGFTIHALTDHPVLALTPADFWRRYNRDAGRFLYENVFRRIPIRSFAARTLIVFVANGFVHEYLALLALGRVTGHQVAFFTLNGIAVAVSARWKPSGAAALASRAATLLFFVFSSLLFFETIDAAFPWYQRR